MSIKRQSSHQPIADSPPAIFHVEGADSLSAAEIVRWAFGIRDTLRGETQDAVESTNGADFTGEALPGDSRNGSPGVVATDGPESS